MKARPSDDAIDARVRRFLAQDAEEAAAVALPVEEVADRLLTALQPRRHQPQRQLIVLIAVLAMLAVAIATAVLVGSQEKQLTPAEIVTWSQGILRDPPAFVMTVRFKDGNEARYLYDGDSTLRVEVTKGTFYDGTGQGGFMLFDGHRAGRYDPLVRIWGMSDYPLDWRALVRPSWLPTGGPVAAGAPAWTSFKDCGDQWRQEPVATVAGRSAYVMACGGATYWVDRETGLLLGTEDPRGTPDSNVTVLSLDLGVAAAPELFAFQAPSDAVPDDRASFLFNVGDQAPGWTAPLVNGGTFDSQSLAGHPAAILFSSPPCCEGDPGLSLLVALDSYVRDHPGVLDAVVVAVPGQRDQVVDMSSKAGVTLPITSDTDSKVWQAWGLRDAPLILLSADGRIAIFWSRALAADDLARMVDALGSGAPIPTPAVSPCTC